MTEKQTRWFLVLNAFIAGVAIGVAFSAVVVFFA